MGVRMIFISMIIALGFFYVGIIVWIDFKMRKTIIDGQSMMERSVNNQENTSKMGLGEILVHLGMIAVAVLFTRSIVAYGGAGFNNLGIYIILPTVISFFNARKRTGKTVILLSSIILFAFYLFLVNLLIGLPVKQPVITVNNTKIVMSKTTVADVLKDGFDIYIRKGKYVNTNYENILSEGGFKKYSADRSLFVKEGFKTDTGSIYTDPYLLVKDGLVIASFGVFGHMDKEVVLEDCKIINFYIDEDCIDAARDNSVSYDLEGIDLLETLDQSQLQKKFKKKLWLVPPSDADITELTYGLSWTTNSGHFFWNEYFAYIDFDKKDKLTKFRFSTNVARDSKKIW